jgi:hypothetical protein
MRLASSLEPVVPSGYPRLAGGVGVGRVLSAARFPRLLSDAECCMLLCVARCSLLLSTVLFSFLSVHGCPYTTLLVCSAHLALMWWSRLVPLTHLPHR